MPTDVDILVVGGGPAGLAAAEAAARAGARVLVVHRDAQIGVPVRTSGGSWRGHLDELSIPPHLYHPLTTLHFRTPGRCVTKRLTTGGPVILDITGTYRYLADLARAAGAEVVCGTGFVSMRERADGALISTLSTGEEVASRLVVDASGYVRAVLSAVGAHTKPRRMGVGYEYEMEDLSSVREEATLFVGQRFCPSGYGWTFPTRAGTVRIGVGILHPDTDDQPRRLLDAFLASTLPAEFGLRLGRILERHVGIIPSDAPGVAMVQGAVIAVGDSASQALPLVGEGIRYVVEAGRVAGQQAALAAREPAQREHHLNAYARWWKQKYRRGFQAAFKANCRVSGFTDAQWDQLADVMQAMPPKLLAAAFRAEMPVLPALWFGLRHPRLSASMHRLLHTPV